MRKTLIVDKLFSDAGWGWKFLLIFRRLFSSRSDEISAEIIFFCTQSCLRSFVTLNWTAWFSDDFDCRLWPEVVNCLHNFDVLNLRRFSSCRGWLNLSNQKLLSSQFVAMLHSNRYYDDERAIELQWVGKSFYVKVKVKVHRIESLLAYRESLFINRHPWTQSLSPKIKLEKQSWTMKSSSIVFGNHRKARKEIFYLGQRGGRGWKDNRREHIGAIIITIHTFDALIHRPRLNKRWNVWRKL